MKFTQWLGGKFGLTDRAGWAYFAGGGAASGKVVTPDSAMQLATFWACVRITASVVASLPLALYQKDADGGRNPVDHDLVPLFTDSPNGEMTAFEFWEAATAWLLVTGNAFAEISRSGNRIVSLQLLPSDQVQVTRDENYNLHYRFTDRGQIVDLPPESVLHLKGFGFGGDLGLSIVRFGVQAIGNAIAAEDAAGKAFGNGLMPAGVITTDTALNPEQREQIGGILEKYASSTNAGKVLVLEAGMKFDQISLNPDDGQLLETRRFSVEEICRWFGVPPVVIGHAAAGVTAWGTGIESLMLQWLETGLNPVLRRIESRLRFQLLAPAERRAGIYPEFNREALLQTDSGAKAAFLSTMVQNGLMSRSEGRAKLNLSRRPEADVLTAQVNLAPLDRLGAATAEAGAKSALKAWLGIEEKNDAAEA